MTAESAPEVGEMGATSLQARLASGEPLVLLDVREEHERAYARIETPAGIGDLHIPLGQIPTRVDEVVDQTRGLPLIVYCHHGQRSMVAATWLLRRGVSEVYNLDGGIDAWSIRVERSVPRY